MNDGRSREEEIYLHHKQGHRVPVQVRIIPIQDKDKKIIGATLSRGDGDIRQLIQRADELMYSCKKFGRNCVTSDL
jgi:PleD family two-component response regulator